MRHLFSWTAALCLTAVHIVSAQQAATRLELTVLDSGTGKPVPCRVHLKDPEGKPVKADGLPFWQDHFVCDGKVLLNLSPGLHQYEVEHGPEFSTMKGSFQAYGRDMKLEVRLERLADLAAEGWRSGDLHVHRSPQDMPALMRAENLHVAPVLTWWNKRNNWLTEPIPADPLKVVDGSRYYHVMGGEDEREGGALLYFNLKAPLPIAGADREHPSPMHYLAEARKHPGVWVDIEKPFWWDVPIWLASGQADSIGIAHNHMFRTNVSDREAWGKPRDTARYPAPHGNGHWTQDIYYHALNCGLRIPPSAGSASGVKQDSIGYNRAHVHTGGDTTYEGWWEGLRAGRVFVSNGPLLRCRANGQLPGHVFKAPAGQTLKIEVEAKLTSRDPISRIELIKNGRMERAVPYEEWKKTGSLGTVEFNESGWFLIRTIADVPETFRFASTGPYYVEVGEAKERISKASARFFLDWVEERAARVKVPDPAKRAEVMAHHEMARRFWTDKLARANAE